eukprot:m.87182 g.87182  ORF g.87182 m.87182 type:complete len:494 (+) comp14899_c2_seq1:152-1633(+)
MTTIGVLVLSLLAAAATCGMVVQASTVKPSLVFVLADDLGHFTLGYDNNPNATTPNLDRVVKHEGLRLTNHYVYQYCSPTRSSFLSGRLPLHVNTKNHPSTENGGVDLRMTLLSEKLTAQGYESAVFGKWHAGAYTYGHLPVNRGFSQSLGYLNGMEDHYTHYFGMIKGYDMWGNHSVAQNYQGVYGGDIYRKHAVEFLENTPLSKPVFLYVPFQVTHAPLEAPAQYFDPALNKTKRQPYYAMASFLDAGFGDIVDTLKSTGRWNNTLLVFSADNGGPTGSGSNYPLRGFKYDDYQGGVKVTAFASGGLLPAAMRGGFTPGYIHICDWYATFSKLAGASPDDDTEAVRNGIVPATDSLDVGPVVFSNASSPRTEVPISVNTLIQDGFKLMNGGTVDIGWSPPSYPDKPVAKVKQNCPDGACLFHLATDPNERTEVSSQYAHIKKQMLAQLEKIAKTAFQSGADGYVGNYTHCVNKATMLKKHDGYIAPLCNDS